MEKLLSNREMRAADAYTIGALGVSSEALMGRAGRAIALETAKAAKELGIKDILVVCGAGNNGGDGYVCARELSALGFAVRVYEAGEERSADCLRERGRYTGAYTTEISAPLIVDCLFGTGLSRAVEGVFAETIERINSSGAYVVSADIPSGINGDNGLEMGVAVRADLTVAIAEYKLGHFLSDGLDHCGKVIKKDIGIALPDSRYAVLTECGDIKGAFPARRRNTNKGDYGCAGLVAGSEKYVGAAALAAGGALSAGCGYVKLFCDEKVKYALAAGLPQVIFAESGILSSSAIAIGCGCGVSAGLYERLCMLLEEYGGTLIIDADGLNALAEYGVSPLLKSAASVVLTPHVKEFSRLSGLTVGQVLSDPVNAAREFAAKYGVTVLLKSCSSVLTDGVRTAVLNRGNSALAKGGSGDMLAGFACGIAARGIGGFEAVAAASYLMGMTAEICAAEKTEYCVTAEDILKNLHIAVRNLTR